MPKYTNIDVSEQQLEDLVRQHVDLLEEGWDMWVIRGLRNQVDSMSFS
jgi:hypothetical protein